MRDAGYGIKGRYSMLDEKPDTGCGIKTDTRCSILDAGY
jgi:hypothetical protein